MEKYVVTHCNGVAKTYKGLGTRVVLQMVMCAY